MTEVLPQAGSVPLEPEPPGSEPPGPVSPVARQPRTAAALPVIFGFGAFWGAVALPDPERKRKSS